MTIPVWPISLPQVPQKGFQESIGINVIRSPTEMGPAKQRVRGARPNELELTFILTTVQTQTLESFIKDTLSGVKRFTFKHPRLSTNIETRIVPQQGGEFFKLQYLAPGYWTTSIKFEILP
jgi:hypothetical protein